MEKTTITKGELMDLIRTVVSDCVAEGLVSSDLQLAEEAVEKTGAKVKTTKASKAKAKTTKASKSYLIILGYEDTASWTAAMNKARRQGFVAARDKGGEWADWNAAGIKAAAKVAGAKVKTVKATSFVAAVAKATR